MKKPIGLGIWHCKIGDEVCTSHIRGLKGSGLMHGLWSSAIVHSLNSCRKPRKVEEIKYV